jgi:hypothetical protein
MEFVKGKLLLLKALTAPAVQGKPIIQILQSNSEDCGMKTDISFKYS